jgi:hypothetical protein
VAVWEERVTTAAQAWIEPAGGMVTNVAVLSTTALVTVQVPGALPDAADLVASLEGDVPTGVLVVVDAGVGERIDAGTVGGPAAGG